MKFKKVLSFALAAVMALSMVACGESTSKVETLNTGKYEGFGVKYEYNPEFWLNLYNNAGSDITSSSISMYNDNMSVVAEVGRIDAMATDVQSAEKFIKEQIDFFRANGEITEESVTPGENRVDANFTIIPTVEEGVDALPTYHFEMHCTVKDGKSVWVLVRSEDTVKEEGKKEFKKIVSSLDFSEVEVPGEAHDENELLYNFDITLSDVEGATEIKAATYKDAQGKDHVGYVLKNPEDEKSVWTYASSTAKDSESTLNASSDGITMYHYAIPLDSYSTAADIITSQVGAWYDNMVKEGSGYYSSKLNKSYSELSLEADEVTFVMGYAFTETEYEMDENGQPLTTEDGAYIAVSEPKVVDTFVDIFHIQKTEGGYEYTNVEATGSALTERGKTAIKEFASLYNSDVSGDDILSIFTEFTTPVEVIEVPVEEVPAE